MKQLERKNVMDILLFILLLALAVSISVPLSKKIDNRLNMMAKSIAVDFENTTGFSLTYTSLSPSIFRKLVFTGLKISDLRTGTVIASIPQASLSYDILALLQGKPEESLQFITLKNGSIHIDALIHQDALMRLQSLFSSGTTSTHEAAMNLEAHLVNFRIFVSGAAFSIDSMISSGTIMLKDNRIKADIDSSISLASPLFEDFGFVECGVKMDAAIDLNAKAGNAGIRLKQINNKLFSLSSLAFILSYRDGVVAIDSIQNIQPYDLHCAWVLDSRVLSASFVSDRLQPLRWIEFKDAARIPCNLKNSELTGSANLSWNPEGGWVWSTDFSAAAPAAFYGGGRLDLNAYGSNSIINLDSLTFNGSSGTVFMEGSYDIETGVPEGYVSITELSLPGFPVFSGDVYIQGGPGQAELLLPEVRLGNSSWTSVSLSAAKNDTRIDFSAFAYDSTGKLGFDGSFLLGQNPFLEIYASFDSVSAHDALNAMYSFPQLQSLLPGKELIDASRGYELTTEMYVSSDLESFSYNLPRLVLASTIQDGRYLLLSSNGTERGVELSDISISFGDQKVTGSISTNFDSYGDVSFDCSLVYGALPYEVSGIYSDRELSFFGMYNLSGSVLFDSMGGISGNIVSSGLPVSVESLLLSIDVESSFVLLPDKTWKIDIENANLQEMGTLLPLDSILSFSGSLEPSGIFLDRVSISDSASDVAGTFSMTVIPSVEGTSRYSIDSSLSTASREELYQISGQVFKADELYFEARGQFSRIPLSRFLKSQTESNVISMECTMSGTPGTAFATARISDVVYRVGEFDLDAQASIILEDGTVSITEGIGSWHGNTFSDVSGTFSLDDFSGSVTALYNGVLGKKGVSATLFASLDSEIGQEPSAKSKKFDVVRIPEYFSVKTVFSNLSWGGFSVSNPVSCNFIRQPGITEVFAGKERIVSGYLLDDGTFSLSATGTSPILFTAEGLLNSSTVDIAVSGIRSDLSRLTASGAIEGITILKGSIDGELSITGIVNDPDFSGSITARDIIISIPLLFSESVGPFSFELAGTGKTIAVPTFSIPVGTGLCKADAIIEFDRWIPSEFSINLQTEQSKLIPVDVKSSRFKSKAFVWADLAAKYDSSGMNISGRTGIERGFIAVSLAPDESSGASVYDLPDFVANLSFSIGNKVEFLGQLDALPIIRGLAVAGKPLSLEIDTSAETFRIRGEAMLKGGEIFYFKRNFYLREGRITLNENQTLFDPLITVRAEVRERDSDGKPVRIILKVDNQPLASFVPVLTSDPLKSENEILALLGQITSADTSRETFIRDTVVTASDLLTQISLFRGAENALRDVLNLDIFSVRTLIIQNAVLGSTMQPETGGPMTIGNYFDNTTVYMGKYLGSAMYADLLTHFSYYDPKSAKNAGDAQGVYGNMLIQPELGLEVTTPLFMLRWAIMPSHPETLFVSDNSVTLSWKFSY